MLSNFLFSLQALSPIFIIIIFGWFLYRQDIINDNFVSVASKLVMNVTFPLLLLLKISELDIKQNVNLTEIAVIYIVFVTIFITSWILGSLMKLDLRAHGAFVQGIFRGNFGILGLAICGNMYGEQGIAIAAVYLAFLIPLYNLFSVVALSRCDQEGQPFSVKQFLKKLILNPLIISIAAGILLSIFKQEIPSLLYTPANYLGSISLPIALLCVGAGLKFKNRDYSLRDTLIATAMKLVALPIIGTLIAISMGMTGINLATLFVLFSVPTAIVTFPLAQAMNGNARLASAIVVFSTLFSSITMAIGITTLKTLNLI